MTQDGHLFHDTIAANLRYARPEAVEDELWDALRKARLETLVRSLPDGLGTLVGERGYRLSGGERQRLTIARLLLARPRVVILDEALAGRTSLVIAHRLSTIRAADTVLVIERGVPDPVRRYAHRLRYVSDLCCYDDTNHSRTPAAVI